MASTSDRAICFICHKEKITYPCHGCSKRFCLDDLFKHRQSLRQELDQIQNDHDQLRQNLNDHKTDSTKHSLVKQINQWEKNSIEKIQQMAESCRLEAINYSKEYLSNIEQKLYDLAEQIKRIDRENEFNELDLHQLKGKLQKLENELHQPTNVSIRQQSTTFIDKISLIGILHKDLQWKQFATTIAGGNGEGDRLDQLSRPLGICFDNEKQTIYIADFDNHRIMEWTSNSTNGRIVAGRKERGNRTDQLNGPTDVTIDRQNNSLIIADAGNKRVMRWSRDKNVHGTIIISDIDCWGLAMHEDGSLYVCDRTKHEIRRWKKGETQGALVAGGNGKGNQLNQLDGPTYLFVKHDHTLLISDSANHRVMKWMKDAKEGTVVAGGNGRGAQTTQLSFPSGVVVDRFDQIYVSDYNNNRVMQWCEGAKAGAIVTGGIGKGQDANQLNGPYGLLLDTDRNLYVADCQNHRIQKFEIV